MKKHLVLIAVLVGCNNSTPPSNAKSTTSAAAAASVPGSADTFPTPSGDLTVTPIHHATFLLRVAGKAIYFDPVSDGASYDGLPKADFVFVTDIHPDHMDPKGLDKVKQASTVVVAPPAVSETMPAGVVMKNGDTHDFGLFTAEAAAMYNITRGPAPGKLFHDKGRGNGYVLTFGKAGAGGKRVYVSGDTECTPEMKALKDIDVAFVCMNLPYTMPPAEAAECVNEFKPKVLFPYHYKGSNLDELKSAIKPASSLDVRERRWYLSVP